MQQFEISVLKTARYCTTGTLNENTKYIWFVCHGYQQLARYFIANFNKLDESHYVVAPEGLHRSYLNGTNGRVGAGWMTSEDRLNDIKDYVNYLDQLYNTILAQLDHTPVVNVLGFSQGGATVSRWACIGKSKIDNLILWSTVFPPDLNFVVDSITLNKQNLQLAIGDNDEYLSKETFNDHLDILEENKVNYKVTKFIGGHKIYPEALSKVVANF